MNKIFFAFRFSQKSLIPIYCIVLILIPCFVHPAFSMERSPIHKTIIQGPNVFKALVPSFRLRISHVIIERIGFSLEVVLQEHQPVEKLSARGSILWLYQKTKIVVTEPIIAPIIAPISPVQLVASFVLLSTLTVKYHSHDLCYFKAASHMELQ